MAKELGGGWRALGGGVYWHFVHAVTQEADTDTPLYESRMLFVYFSAPPES